MSISQKKDVERWRVGAFWVGGDLILAAIKTKALYFLCGKVSEFGVLCCVGDQLCVGFGEMGSYGQLARRAVETDMPVMVQVLRPKLQLGFVQVFEFNLFRASIFVLKLVKFVVV